MICIKKNLYMNKAEKISLYFKLTDAIEVLFNVGFGFFAVSLVMVSLANRFRDSAGIAFVLVVTILGRNDDICSTWRGFAVNTRLT